MQGRVKKQLNSIKHSRYLMIIQIRDEDSDLVSFKLLQFETIHYQKTIAMIFAFKSSFSAFA